MAEPLSPQPQPLPEFAPASPPQNPKRLHTAPAESSALSAPRVGLQVAYDAVKKRST